MENVSPALMFLRLLVWAAPVAALAWLAFRLFIREKPEAGGLAHVQVVPLAFGVILALIAAFAGQKLMGGASGGQVVWISILAGASGPALAALVTPAFSSTNGASEAADRVMVGVAAGALPAAFLVLRHSARAEEWLIAAGIGAAAFGVGWLFSQHRTPTATGESVATATAVVCLISISLLLGKQSFTAFNRAGDIAAFTLSLGLLAWLAFSVIGRSAIALGRVAIWVLFASYILVTGALVWFAVPVASVDSSVAVCILAGLAAGTFAAVFHALGAFREDGAVSRQAAGAVFVLVLTAAALGLRTLLGYGGVLVAVGFLLAIPGWSMLAAVRATAREAHWEEFSPAILLWPVAFLTVFGVLRAWLTFESARNIAIYQPYPFLALALGIALPFLVRGILLDKEPGEQARFADGLLQVALGVAMTVSAVVLTSVLFREPAVRLLLLGVASSGLAMAALLGAGGILRAGAEVTVSSLFTGFMALGLSGRLADVSIAAGRTEKMQGIALWLGITLAIYLALELWRWFSGRARLAEGSAAR